MNLLFVTRDLASSPGHGGQIRDWLTFRALTNCGSVDVVTFGDPRVPSDGGIRQSARRVTVVGREWLKRTPAQNERYQSTIGRFWMTLLNPRPLMFVGPANRPLANWFAQLVRRERYDIIWICRAELAIALSWRDPRRTILDAADFEYVPSYQLLRTSPWYGAKLCNYVDVAKLACWEHQWRRWFAAVARCSEVDCAKDRGRNVFLIPNGITAPAERAPQRSAECRILFVGTLGYAPNADGIEWFLKTVWPSIRASVPEANIDIVGAGAPSWLNERNGTDGIVVHGFAKSLEVFWSRSALSIAPLRAGGGTRIKILESIGHRVPVVSTTTGAYGLSLGTAEGLVRADSPQLFADLCVRIIKNPGSWARQAAQGQTIVARRYSAEAVRRQVETLVNAIAGRKLQGPAAVSTAVY